MAGQFDVALADHARRLLFRTVAGTSPGDVPLQPRVCPYRCARCAHTTPHACAHLARRRRRGREGTRQEGRHHMPHCMASPATPAAHGTQGTRTFTAYLRTCTPSLLLPTHPHTFAEACTPTPHANPQVVFMGLGLWPLTFSNLLTALLPTCKHLAFPYSFCMATWICHLSKVTASRQQGDGIFDALFRPLPCVCPAPRDDSQPPASVLNTKRRTCEPGAGRTYGTGTFICSVPSAGRSSYRSSGPLRKQTSRTSAGGAAFGRRF